MAQAWQERQTALLGEEKTDLLAEKRVLVLGAGGVGGSLIEALARAGVGHITVADGDCFSHTNRNRQILCTVDTVGKSKALVAVERILSVNPACEAVAEPIFADESNLPALLERSAPDYVADAIDSVRTKIELAVLCRDRGIPLISCMGTGNKVDMTRLRVTDISKTEVCPLAKAVRIGLRKRGITHLPVVFSTEEPVRLGSRTPASVSYVPEAAGLLMAQTILLDWIGTP